VNERSFVNIAHIKLSKAQLWGIRYYPNLYSNRIVQGWQISIGDEESIIYNNVGKYMWSWTSPQICREYVENGIYIFLTWCWMLNEWVFDARLMEQEVTRFFILFLFHTTLIDRPIDSVASIRLFVCLCSVSHLTHLMTPLFLQLNNAFLSHVFVG